MVVPLNVTDENLENKIKLNKVTSVENGTKYKDIYSLLISSPLVTFIYLFLVRRRRKMEG